ncbi:MAG TPA: DNA repair protein RecN [Pseudomonadales bacterium]|nr:DNA repair protein RecN [Pseudomonadales bacterium]
MLSRLDIRNFTIVDALTVDFAPGFTTITGETGAGKSIMLDALGLVLGDRANSDLVRPGTDGADLTAEFDIGAIDEARAWLDERELADADAPELVLLRRTLGADGRSRAYVNGRPVTLQDIRALADHLIDIHSQHAHQSLLRRDVQRRLLDEFGGHEATATGVAEAHGRWHDLAQELTELRAAADELADRRQLLGYQLEELDAVAPEADEQDRLEVEQRRLAGADDAIRRVDGARVALEEDDDALGDRLARVITQLGDLDDPHPSLVSALEMLESARVNVDEAAAELRRFGEALEPDPQRLEAVDARLTLLHDLARKHRVRAEALAPLHASLREEYEALDATDARTAALEAEVTSARDALQTQARALSAARTKAAKKLEKAVTKQLAELGMADARFLVQLEPLEGGRCSAHGLEGVEFHVSANAGMDPGPLGRVASGGELSRISLAIEVITAATSRIPSLVLDEADVGIGGGTAEVVGRLLRRLGAHTQVLAVTHLPQVAALGHQHFAARKVKAAAKGATSTKIETLDAAQRVAELARMLGGVEITDQTRAHASEMLARAADAA